MAHLREQDPTGYERLLRSRNTPWGQHPLAGPPLSRCVDHLIGMIGFALNGGKGKVELKEGNKLERALFESSG